jgi:hypothetical protein
MELAVPAVRESPPLSYICRSEYADCMERAGFMDDEGKGMILGRTRSLFVLVLVP